EERSERRAHAAPIQEEQPRALLSQRRLLGQSLDAPPSNLVDALLQRILRKGPLGRSARGLRVRFDPESLPLPGISRERGHAPALWIEPLPFDGIAMYVELPQGFQQARALALLSAQRRDGRSLGRALTEVLLHRW